MRSDNAAMQCSTLYGGSAPTPQSILGSQLILDLNGDLGVSGSGGRAATWLDQSAKANHQAQPTFGNQPTWLAADLDGHRAVQFVAATTRKMSGTFTGIAAGNKVRWYMIGSCVSTLPNYCLYELTDNGANNRCANLLMSGGILCRFVLGGTTQLRDASTTATTAVKLYDGMINPADQSELGINAASVATSTATVGGMSRAPTTLQLGTLADGTNFPFDGKMYRFVYAQPVPSAAQHAALLAYFKSTYPSLGLP